MSPTSRLDRWLPSLLGSLLLMTTLHGAELVGRAGQDRAIVTAALDGRLRVSLVSRRSLTYAAGADAASDRPGHVRAASAVGWLGDRLAIAQDDAAFVGLWDPATSVVDFIALPAGAGGLRQFDNVHHNKSLKLDLEAAAVTLSTSTPTLVLFGSGSSPHRESIVRLHLGGPGVTPSLRQQHVRPFYEALRSRRSFSGSELNIEGAALLPDGRLCLLQRGNGAPKKSLGPVNALVEMDWGPFEAWLDQRPGAGLPSLGDVTPYDLGKIKGVPLTFTDATPAPGGRILFLASAEDSPDCLRDGPVVATAVGVIDPDGRARMTLLEDGSGPEKPLKIEGLSLDRTRPGRVYIVADPDDHRVPATLITADLVGPWWD